MTPEDGGPAFPRAQTAYCDQCHRWTDGEHLQKGLTIRDWFGGMALQGLLSNGIPHPSDLTGHGVERLARTAYGYAEAMLTARKAGQGDARGS